MIFRVCGHNIIETHRYLIQTIDYSKIPTTNNRITFKYITDENVCSIYDGYFRQSFRSKFLIKQPDLFRGFLFFMEEQPVGYMFVGLRGAKDQILQVKDADSYIAQIEVFEEFRGNHLAYDMIFLVADELLKQGLKSFVLACNPSNSSAMELYRKLGFRVIKEIKYVRIMKWNIPQIIV